MIKTGAKVWIFIMLLCLTFLIAGYTFGGRLGLFVGLCASVFINLLVFFFGESRLLEALGAERVRGQDPWNVQEKLREYSRHLQCPEPLFFLLETRTPTAFSLSFSRLRPCICLSRGLLEKLNIQEVDAVLAHEISHISRLDSFGFAVVSVLANSLMGFAGILDQFWFPNWFLNRQKKPFLTILSPLGWALMNLVVTDKLYYENDRLASEMIQNRRLLGEVLWKLESYAQSLPMKVPPFTSHLFIVNPEGLLESNPMFRAHPRLESRLKTLVGAYPI